MSNTLNLIRKDNGFFFRTSVITSEKTGLPVSGATVTGTLLELGGTEEVSGITWPVSMPEIGASAIYESAVIDARSFSLQTVRRLRAYCEIDAGGVLGRIWADVRFRE